MISAGVVLSQPPINTAPSTGYERRSSSVSIASRLRYISGDGFMNGSDSVITGISRGKPPACQMPRLISSARTRKCAWHWLMSLHVLTIAITGLPAKSSRVKPVCSVRERCPNARKSCAPYHLWLRSSSGFLRCWAINENPLCQRQKHLPQRKQGKAKNRNQSHCSGSVFLSDLCALCSYAFSFL